MNNLKPLKLLGLIFGIALLNIIILSPGLAGVNIRSGNALEAATGVTVLIVSVFVLFYGSYALMFKPAAAPPVKNVQNHEDYVEALNYYRNVKPLRKDVDLAVDQLERMEKKKKTLFDVLGQRFNSAELSYKKFAAVIAEVEKLFYLNARGILNKLSVFDASSFSGSAAQQGAASFSNRLMQQKTELYNEYLSYVTGYLGANEEILLKLDKLMLEISLLGSADYRDVDDMPCMKEIDALIKQTKFYKQ